MASHQAVRKIALSLPGVRDQTSQAGQPGERLVFSAERKGKDKSLAWSWLERTHPKKARVPNRDVLAIRVANLQDKEALLAVDGERFFTEPHYNGYPAVLVRLAEVSEAELRKLLTDAWQCTAPKELTGAAPTAKPKKTAKTAKPKKTAKTAKPKKTAKTAKKKPAARQPSTSQSAAKTTAAKQPPAAEKQPAKLPSAKKRAAASE